MMLLFCFVYLVIFSVIYVLHTHNIDLQDGERGFGFFIGTSLSFSVLAAMGSSYALDIAAQSPLLSAIATICVALLISVEFVCCLEIFEKKNQKEINLLRFQSQKSDLEQDKIRQVLHYLDVQHRGLLMEMPFQQGESVFWIDYDAVPPKIRQMYFVTVVSDCYIGLSENETEIITVPDVYTCAHFAEETLYAQQWMRKAR